MSPALVGSLGSYCVMIWDESGGRREQVTKIAQLREKG